MVSLLTRKKSLLAFPDSVKVFNGDVLFSWSASLEVILWVFGDGGLNQHIFKVASANDFPKSFYYHQLLDYVDVFKKWQRQEKQQWDILPKTIYDKGIGSLYFKH